MRLSLEHSKAVIVTTAGLHNLAIEERDEPSEVDDHNAIEKIVPHFNSDVNNNQRNCEKYRRWKQKRSEHNMLSVHFNAIRHLILRAGYPAIWCMELRNNRYGLLNERVEKSIDEV
ncbi:hypothetical protein D910_04693 [Dendroctonus ponderosae]|uniref:Uncharacterized protein n=1 Tax=Dendroctonus ponderosae TaxID=77166 RepID=U4U4M4_DENPD|nr:hypothetical protein D910_04693 [Dendroctonus ponderosae]